LRGEVREAIEEALGTRVLEARPVTGGDVNEAFRLELEGDAPMFVKTHPRPPQGFYEAEADGLALLRSTGAVRVPQVLAVGDGRAPFLALEWIEAGPRTPAFDDALGRALARMHGAARASFGHSRDNFIGPLPQPNAAMPTWPEFYRERRLAPVIAAAAARLDLEVRRSLDRLLPRVDELAATDEPPCVVHGDLWSGNVMADTAGAPCLVDPAAYAGNREVDLAMLMLFGAPSERFFSAYDEVAPREPGFAARVPLYQLYFLLVHVALFGAGYLSSVKRSLGALE
jgi:fructosamine-3-kinase